MGLPGAAPDQPHHKQLPGLLCHSWGCRARVTAGTHLGAASLPQFLINREGQVVKRYSPMEDPYVSLLRAWGVAQLCLTCRKGEAELSADHLCGETAVPGPSTARSRLCCCVSALFCFGWGRKGSVGGGCSTGEEWMPSAGLVGGSEQSLWGLRACFWGNDVLVAQRSLPSRR